MNNFTVVLRQFYAKGAVFKTLRFINPENLLQFPLLGQCRFYSAVGMM